MFSFGKSRKTLYSLLVVLLITGSGTSVFAAKKKPTKLTPSSKTSKTADKKDGQKNENSDQEQNSEDSSVKLSTDSFNRNYFSKIDPSIVTLVENGSPESLKTAMQKIRKSESEYTENEKILIATATEIMQIVWPTEKVTWSSYTVTQDNPYLGAINSAKKGVFDSSTGNVDFLTTLLPSLVILTSKVNASVYADCEKAIIDSLFYNYNSCLANYMAGVLYEKTERYSESESYLAKAYYDAPKNIELALEYSKVLGKLGRAEEAKKIIASLAGAGGTEAGSAYSVANDLLILKQNAYIAFDTGNYTEAEECVAKVLQQTPNDLEFVLFRAKIFMAKNDYIHAVSLLDMYSRQNDTNHDYLILRAKVQLEWSKNTSAATDTIEKALQLYPTSDEALMIAAKIAAATDSPVAGKYADELAGLVLANNPGNAEALVYALDGLIKRENWISAYSNSSVLIKKSPDDAEIVMRHVKVCLQLNKKTEALDAATKAYASNSSDETIAQAYVYAYTETNSRENSLALVEKLMNGASPKMKSYLLYRRSYLQKTEDASLADLRSSLIANPRNSEALFRLYEVYYAKHDYRKAQYYLRQVVALNPNDGSAKKLNEALTQLIQ